ncbi:MAG: hypothetical protein HYX23_00110 [Candidatus Zambryskibacteria bacterium]|nr:hypothetical protein [Candidatus Zambryskibacteria bacterium]
MKLFKMRTVPKKAGMAKLQFGYKGGAHAPPFRESTDIVLPDNPESEFFPLMNGEQFLLRIISGGSETQYWFGGTDERPFLVRLRDEPFRAFQREGDDSFYAALKPEVITKFEQAFRVASKRQGDIFAVPIPHTWDEIQQASLLCLGTKQEPKNVKSQPMFGTRHKLNGLYTERARIFGDNHTLGEGVLKAPDHSPLKLEQVHLIVQARNLYEPRLAD